MNNNNILSIAVIGLIAYSGYKIYTYTKSKRIGQSCQFDSGPDGVVVYSFDTAQNEPQFKCRRCNPTGCASYELDKNKILLYGK